MISVKNMKKIVTLKGQESRKYNFLTKDLAKRFQLKRSRKLKMFLI